MNLKGYNALLRCQSQQRKSVEENMARSMKYRKLIPLLHELTWNDPFGSFRNVLNTPGDARGVSFSARVIFKCLFDVLSVYVHNYVGNF